MPSSSQAAAPLVASWGGRWKPMPYAPAPDKGAPPPAGAPILQQQLGQGSCYVVVEIAWGAQPLTNASTWSWTDVTSDVLYDSKINMTIGGQDETQTPQPASCTMHLKNYNGQYSHGGQSVNYPYVRRGVPVRVRIVLNGVSFTRFFGYATGFTPKWDATGNFAYVELTANGNKRRLLQQVSPVQSVLRRSLPLIPGVIAYWPCEDGQQSTQLNSGLQGGPPIALSNIPNLASNSAFPASNPLPTFATDTWTGSIPAYQDAGSLGVQWLHQAPTTVFPDQTRLLVIYTTGSVARVELRYSGAYANGVCFVVYDHAGTQLIAPGSVYGGVNLGPSLLQFGWTQSGGTITFRQQFQQLGSMGYGTGGNTATLSGNIVSASSIVFNPDGTITGSTAGHIYVRTPFVGLDQYTDHAKTNAYIEEYTRDRLPRLAQEQGEYFTDRSTMPGQQSCGPQFPDTFINLMEGTNAVEQGLLFDGLDQGLSWVSGPTHTNRPVDMIIDADVTQIAFPLEPLDDDRLTINSFVAGQTSGSSFVYSNNDPTTDDPVATTGEYQGSAQLSFYSSDAQLRDFAAWKVHMGNLAYRYPTLPLMLHRNPELLPTWLNMVPWNRIDVTNLGSAYPQINQATVSLTLEGWTEIIDQYTYSVTMNTTPYDGWRTGIVATNAGDAGSASAEFLARLDTPGSQTVSGCPVGTVTDSAYENWSVVGGTTVLQTMPTAPVYARGHSALLLPSGSASQTYLQSPTYPVTPGSTQNQAISAWCYCNSLLTGLYFVNIDWLDSSQSFISNMAVILPNMPANQWTYLGGTFSPPSNAAYAVAIVGINGNVSNTTRFYVGSAMMGPTSTVTVQQTIVGVPLWTTNASDFPMDLNIYGNAVKCISITGSSSPQTFYLDPSTVNYAIPGNVPVSVRNPGPLNMAGRTQ